MADEATDAANKEQLAVCICTLKIEERFLGFSECETGVSGQAIGAFFNFWKHGSFPATWPNL